MNKFENLPDYGNLFPIMLNVILNISVIVGRNLPDSKKQMLAALMWLEIHVFSFKGSVLGFFWSRDLHLTFTV